MATISKRLGFFVTLAAGIVYAGCAGAQQIGQKAFPQQIGQKAFPRLQEDVASTPLPGAVSHRASRPLPGNALSGRLLYVSGTGSNSVDIFPLTRPNQPQVGSISNGVSWPWGLSLDAHNSLYVADPGNKSVTVYPNGSSTPSMTYLAGPPRPLYALADSAGHVYASGQNKSYGRILEYNAGSDVPIARARVGLEADGMAADAQGNLYVAYRDAKHQGSIAEFGPGLTNRRNLGMTINQPQGLLVDSHGNIVVVESADDDIKVFTPGMKTPSVTLNITGVGNLAQLAMRNSETTLWVSSEGGYVYSMPYPLTPSTVATEYDNIPTLSNGIAVTP
jgi:sugar lactone lactonase YvrE